MGVNNENRLDDAAVGALVDSKIKQMTSWYNSKLSQERQQVTSYYNGELPRRQKEGSSSYVSSDVYDSVEGLKAQLLETFASGYEVLKFDPQGPQDIESARIATAYADYVVFRQNDGYRIFNDVLHDGLTARAGVCKVWWDERYEFVEEEFENMEADQVQAMASLEEVTDLTAEMDEDAGLYEGKLTRKLDKSQVCIEVMNPEEFSVESEAKDLSGEWASCHSTFKTKAELIRYGYDKAKVNSVNATDEMQAEFSPERLARFSDFETGVRMRPDDMQDERRHILRSEERRVGKECRSRWSPY